MKDSVVGSKDVKEIKLMRTRLSAEASLEPDPVHSGEIKKETQIIAIYGKGGIGKSFTLANLSYMMAQQKKKVLLIGTTVFTHVIIFNLFKSFIDIS